MLTYGIPPEFRGGVHLVFIFNNLCCPVHIYVVLLSPLCRYACLAGGAEAQDSYRRMDGIQKQGV